MKQRKLIKAIEIETQQHWFPDTEELVHHFENTMAEIVNVFTSFDDNFKDAFLTLKVNCTSCNNQIYISERGTMNIENDENNLCGTPEYLQKVLNSKIANSHWEHFECEKLNLDLTNKIFLLFTFQEMVYFPVNRNLVIGENEYEVSGFSIVNSDKTTKTTFKFERNFYTSVNGCLPNLLKESGLQKASLLMFVKVNKTRAHEGETVEDFTFKKSTLDIMLRQAHKTLDDPEYAQKCMKRKEIQAKYDSKRNINEERIAMKNESDRKRDKTGVRIKMHNKIDKERDQEENE